MKKKFLSYALVASMAVTSVPTTALAESNDVVVQGADTKAGEGNDGSPQAASIMEASATVAEPKVGATPANSATPGADTYTVSEVKWYEQGGTDDNWVELTGDDATFKGGKTYKVTVKFAVAGDSGNTFADNCDYKINGNTATTVDDSGTYSYTFAALQDTQAST